MGRKVASKPSQRRDRDLLHVDSDYVHHAEGHRERHRDGSRDQHRADRVSERVGNVSESHSQLRK
jgi:hypothetical protein